MEIIGSYAPVHSHARTVTYRCEVNTSNWEKFFTKQPDLAFLEKFGPAGFEIDPQTEVSMVEFQNRIEARNEAYYLSASEISRKDLKEKLTVYKLKTDSFE